MAYQISDLVWKHSQQKGSNRLVLLALAEFADKDAALCTLTVAEIADYAVLSHRKTQYSLRALAEAGDISIVEGDAGRRCYHVHPVISPSRGERSYLKSSISHALRRVVFERDAYRCRSCTGYIDLTVDHIIPERHGGTHDLDNLQTLCRQCNSKKGAKVYVG